jgi:hypothetical protein
VNLSIKSRKHIHVPFSKYFILTEMAVSFEVTMFILKTTHQRAGCSGLLAPDIIKTRTSGTMYIHCKGKTVLDFKGIMLLAPLLK